MKQVFSARDMVEVSYIKSILEAIQIPCFIKNEFIAHFGVELYCGIATEPTIWVDEEDFINASKAISSQMQNATAVSNSQNSKCPKCGEEIEAQFDACWKCNE